MDALPATSPPPAATPQQQADLDQFIASRNQPGGPYVGTVTSDIGKMGPQGTVDALYYALPFTNRLDAAINTAGQWFGGETPTYSANLQAVRDAQAAAAAAHPAGAAFLDFAAKTAAPLPLLNPIIRGATTTLGRTALGAVGGGLWGGATGLSETPDLTNTPDAIAHAATGAAVGGALGGAVPLVGGAVGSTVGRLLSAYPFGRLLGTSAPSVEGVSKAAVGRVSDMIDKNGGAAIVGQRLKDLGPDAQLLDASQGLRQQAATVAAKNPAAADQLVEPLKAREAAAPARIKADVDTTMGPFQDAGRVSRDLQQQKNAIVDTELPPVYQNAPPQGVDISPVLATIDGTKSAEGTALASTLSQIRTALTQAPTAPPPLPSGTVSAAQYQQWRQATNAAQAGTRVPVADPEVLQRAKDAIDSMLDYGPRGQGPLAGADARSADIVRGIRGQLDTALRQQVPNYAQTMDKLASINQQQGAIKAGREDSLQQGQATIEPETFAQDWQNKGQTPTFAAGVGLPPSPTDPTLSQAQYAQQIGMRHAMERVVRTKGNDVAAVRNIVQGTPHPDAPPGTITPGEGWNLSNIGTAFGPDAKQGLAKGLNREGEYADSNRIIYQGSQSGQRLAGQEAAAPPQPFQIPGELHNITEPLAGIAGAAHGGINLALARLQGFPPDKWYGDLATLLGSKVDSKTLGQLLANSAARASNRALYAGATAAATRAAGLGAAGVGALLQRTPAASPFTLPVPPVVQQQPQQ